MTTAGYDVPFSDITESDAFAAGLSEGREDSAQMGEWGDAGAKSEPVEPDTAPDPHSEHHSILDTPMAAPSTGKGKRPSPMAAQLEAYYTMAGTGLFMVDQQLGTVVISQAPECARALDELARKDPRVRSALNSILQTGAWSGVIAAHLPIAVAAGTKYVPEMRRRYRESTAARKGAPGQ